MILNNYWNYKAAIESTPLTYNGNRQTSCGLYDLSGTSKDVATGAVNMSSALMNNYSLKTSLGILLGSGDTEPSGTDYCLANNITTSFSSLSASISTSGDGNAQRTVVTISGIWSGGSATTLREIGIKKNILVSTYDSSTADILFIRHMLDQPIDLAPGQSLSVTFEWVEA